MLDRARDIVDLRSVCQLYRTGSVIGSAEDCFADLMHTGLRQTAEAQNLALVKVKAYIVDQARNRYILYRKNHFIRNLLAIIGTIIVTRYLTANHESF